MKIWFRVNGDPQLVEVDDYHETLKNYSLSELIILRDLQLEMMPRGGVHPDTETALVYINTKIAHLDKSYTGGNDPVNKPSHYTDGKIEVIDYIEDKGLGFNLGNCVKYISRAGKKNPDKEVEDLEKAAWYLSRQIQFLKNKPLK